MIGYERKLIRLFKKGNRSRVLSEMTTARHYQGTDLVTTTYAGGSNNQQNRNETVPDLKCLPVPSMKDCWPKRSSYLQQYI